MLRRMKEDVEKSLKPKEETIVEVELTNIQKKYYRGILEKNFSFLQKSGSSANVPNLMNTMMELRKCCIHPYLLNGAEEQIQEDYSSRRSDFQDTEDLFYKALTHSSGKMVLLDKLLPKLKANGHRVLIFSQMVKMLDILEDYLIRKQYPFERIDGRIRGNLRQAAIDRWDFTIIFFTKVSFFWDQSKDMVSRPKKQASDWLTYLSGLPIRGMVFLAANCLN